MKLCAALSYRMIECMIVRGRYHHGKRHKPLDIPVLIAASLDLATHLIKHVIRLGRYDMASRAEGYELARLACGCSAASDDEHIRSLYIYHHGKICHPQPPFISLSYSLLSYRQ